MPWSRSPPRPIHHLSPPPAPHPEPNRVLYAAAIPTTGRFNVDDPADP